MDNAREPAELVEELIFTSQYGAAADIAEMAQHNAMVQRWFEILSSCDFKNKYRTGPQNAHADSVSVAHTS